MVLSFSIQFAVHELRDLGEAEPYRGFEIFFIGHFSTERTPRLQGCILQGKNFLVPHVNSVISIHCSQIPRQE